MSCLLSPGRMSRTRLEACPRGTAGSSSMRRTLSARTVPSSCSQTLATRARAVVAALAPGARVVKAFNSIGIKRFNQGPTKDGGRRVIFVSGDHAEPIEFVKNLIASFGFAPIHLGGLKSSGRMQQAGGPLAGRDLVDFGYH